MVLTIPMVTYIYKMSASEQMFPVSTQLIATYYSCKPLPVHPGMANFSPLTHRIYSH